MHDLKLTPATLAELLSVPLEEIGNVDIARANLICASGLPGAEELDVEQHIRRLDIWAERIALKTQQFLPVFQSNPAIFDNSEPRWRLLVLARVLADEYRVGYHMERIHSHPDWGDSQDLFIHGITGQRRTGTCPSLPVLVVALGRRLGYPICLSHTVGHVFSRWDGNDHENPAWRDRFNIEFSGDVSFHDDEHYYEFPVEWTEQDRKAHKAGASEYLRSFTRRQELAHSLFQRAICLEAIGRYRESALVCQTCIRYDSVWGGYLEFAKNALRAQSERVMTSMGFDPSEFRHFFFRDRAIHPEWRMHLIRATSPMRTHASNNPMTVTYHSPGMTLLTNHHQHFQSQIGPVHSPPTNADAMANLILVKTCEGTRIAPTIDLLLPQFPEREVDPYAKLRDGTGKIQFAN
jgi:hypothetical protein